ncbi:unnamed protein product [Cercopithifilaria johnstoni]|uniref:Uncharacterized protein n=1 Tax=Cercopithifilaria johnstoni TaxID=2874296 RepID=A0A8J2PY28_9BILA|nr:unnamed protein product [Cercopithifilaria johnstoni]
MARSTISTFLLVVSITISLVATKPSIGWNSNGNEELPSFPPEPPSELKSIFPPVTYAQLVAVHRDQSLTIQQKMVKIDEIINALPENILQQLPLPPAFRLLPEYVQEMIKIIRVSKNIAMEDKWLLMILVIESLPNEQRKVLQQMMPNSPTEPLLEFKHILPKDIWNQFIRIYQDANLNNAQKMKRIEELMDRLPGSIRQKLPPTSPFEKLPTEIQEKLQVVHIQQGLSAQQRLQKIKAIIDSLPLEIKKLIFPQ